MPRSARRISLAALPALILVACNSEPAAPPPEANQETSSAVASPSAPIALVKGDGSPAGTVILTETTDGIDVTIAATGLPAGVHGVHLHAVGRCEGPAFESAGDHWNPTSRKHGRDNPLGAHLGDLTNIEIGADGSGSSTFAVATARMTEGVNALMDADGASLVIHAQADDYKTDPSDNNGDRIACAMLKG